MKNYTPICVDASLILRLIMPGDRKESITKLWRSWRTEGREFIAPALIFYELTNALHQYARHGIISDEEAQQILHNISKLNISLIENKYIHHQALKIAQTMGLKATYDAHYLAVAQHANAEFWTADSRLVKQVSQDWPWVHGI